MKASRSQTGCSHAGAGTLRTVMSRLRKRCFLQESMKCPASVRNTRVLRRSGRQASIPRMRYGSSLRDALERERARKLHPLSISEGWGSSRNLFQPMTCGTMFRDVVVLEAVSATAHGKQLGHGQACIFRARKLCCKQGIDDCSGLQVTLRFINPGDIE